MLRFIFKYHISIKVNITPSVYTPDPLAMEYTSLDYFNYYLREFCNEITANFPDFEKGVVANYRELLEAKQSKNDMYVKCFVSRVNDHMEAICKRDVTLFDPSRYIDKATGSAGVLVFIEGVDMLALWNSSFNNEATAASIWKYLQLLVLIGRRVVLNAAEVKEILGQVGGEVYAPAKVEKTLQGKPDDLEDSGNKPDMLGLGGLASLAGMMGIGNGEMPDLSGIVKTIGEQLSNLDMSSIVSEMEKAQSETVTNLESAGEEDTPSDGTSASGPSNLFADLAKEMAETVDFDAMRAGANNSEPPKGINDVFSRLMSGDNAKNIFGLAAKFAQKMQSDVQSGKMKESDLFNPANMASMMGAGMDAKKMKKQAQQLAAENPALVEEARRQQNQSAQGKTAARLKAKLEARQNAANTDQTPQ